MKLKIPAQSGPIIWMRPCRPPAVAVPGRESWAAAGSTASIPMTAVVVRCGHSFVDVAVSLRISKSRNHTVPAVIAIAMYSGFGIRLFLPLFRRLVLFGAVPPSDYKTKLPLVVSEREPVAARDSASFTVTQAVSVAPRAS